MTIGTSGIFSRGRVETFSDGVFAIIVTLLVLELKVPHLGEAVTDARLGDALIALLPKFTSWIISFGTVCVIWVNHHRLFSMYRSITHGLFWWNAFLLLWVSFIPFPTALMGDYHGSALAVSFYGLVMALMALSFSLMRIYVLRNPSVLEERVDVAEFRKGTVLSLLFGPVLYLVGAGCAWAHAYAAFVIYLFIPVYFIFPHATKDAE